MDSSDYQAGRQGDLSPPGGNWSDYHRGIGDQQHWQVNNDAVRRRSSDSGSGSSTETSEFGVAGWCSVLWGLLKLSAVVWIAYKLFFV